MENPTKDGYAFKATSIDSDISCNDYLCLLNNVLLIGTFPVLFPNNTGKMKKKMITLIKSMKKDLQIKLYFEKKITNDKKTIPGTETIVTSSGFVFFCIRGGNSEACQMGRHLSTEVHVILHCS